MGATLQSTREPEYLDENIPAIVILDLHIPHVKGTEILEYMRSNDRLRDVRVIVATADVELAGKMKNSADLVLLKPVGFRQLKDLATRLRP
jgi:DNA-binding response OmpR family regulator